MSRQQTTKKQDKYKLPSPGRSRSPCKFARYLYYDSDPTVPTNAVLTMMVNLEAGYLLILTYEHKHRSIHIRLYNSCTMALSNVDFMKELTYPTLQVVAVDSSSDCVACSRPTLNICYQIQIIKTGINSKSSRPRVEAHDVTNPSLALIVSSSSRRTVGRQQPSASTQILFPSQRRLRD
jgi:hypothetical protein